MFRRPYSAHKKCLGRRSQYRFWLLGLLWLAVSTSSASEPSLRLMSSIKPVQLIVAAIAGERAQAQLLLPSNVSPHLYQLKPSDRQALAQADRFFWVGPQLERFLVKPLSLLPEGQAIALGQETTYSHDTSTHNTSAHDHHHDHSHDDDPHYWLNPAYAIAMAEKVSRALAQLDPAYQAYYEQQLQLFRHEVMQLDQQIRQQFEAIKAPKGYLVLHEAYGHFEQRYGLAHRAAVSINPDRKPGAKKLLTIQRLLDSGEIACVFKEPQYQQAALSKLLQKASVTQGVLDPLASDTVISPQGYIHYMRDFSAAFYRCLAPSPS